MSDERSVKETIEAIRGVGVLTRKGWEIRKQGISGLPKLIEAYGPVAAGIEGAGDIDDEVKDLDAKEIEQIVAALVEEIGTTLESLGVTALKPYLPLVAQSIAAGQSTYETWKPIIEKINAARAK